MCYQLTIETVLIDHVPFIIIAENGIKQSEIYHCLHYNNCTSYFILIPVIPVIQFFLTFI
jgi:hypothetical protein